MIPSKHPRIAVTADAELAEALERVRVATGTREPDATLVRRLAVEGASAEVDARRQRRDAAEELMALMDGGSFDLDLEAGRSAQRAFRYITVTTDLWDGEGIVLADTSAWIVAGRTARAREFLLAAVERGNVAWCWPVRYELMIDARDTDAIAAVDRTLEGLRQIAVDASVQRGVLWTMRELAGPGSHGAHRLPLTDLTVAVAAQRAGLDILHHDHHLERLGELLNIRALWIAEPSH